MGSRLLHDKIFTITFAIFFCFSLVQVCQSPPNIVLIIGIIIFAYFCTDIISGVLHKILDDQKALDISWIKSLAEGFQGHYKDPTKLCKISLYHHLYVMHFPLTIGYSFVLMLNTPVSHCFYIALAIMLHLMQMSHRWSHQPKSTLPSYLQLLQNTHVLLKSSEHGIHHKSPFNTNFCIMNGWFNPCLNYI